MRQGGRTYTGKIEELRHQASRGASGPSSSTDIVVQEDSDDDCQSQGRNYENDSGNASYQNEPPQQVDDSYDHQFDDDYTAYPLACFCGGVPIIKKHLSNNCPSECPQSLISDWYVCVVCVCGFVRVRCVCSDNGLIFAMRFCMNISNDSPRSLMR